MFKVGQKVYCALHGAGIVVKIEDTTVKGILYPVRVDFLTKNDIGYTTEGSLYVGANRTLFFSPVKIIAEKNPPYIPKYKAGDFIAVFCIGEFPRILRVESDDDPGLIIASDAERNTLFINTDLVKVTLVN